MSVIRADSTLEYAALARGARRVAGVDEVGRGPLAGPVTAAAVCLDLARCPEGLADSKTLALARRVVLHDALYATAEVSVAHADVAEIEALNIVGASHLAMCRALDGLPGAPDLALIDGNRLPEGLPCAGEPVVRGDARSLSIAAASIVAKVVRDRLMMDLAKKYPGYGWETNVGYAVPAHHAGLRRLGITPHHRRTFAPVHNILYEEAAINA